MQSEEGRIEQYGEPCFFFHARLHFFLQTTPYLEAKLNGEVQVAIAHAHIMGCYVVNWNAGLQICSTLIVAGVTQNDVREGREKKRRNGERIWKRESNTPVQLQMPRQSCPTRTAGPHSSTGKLQEYVIVDGNEGEGKKR